MEYILIAKVEQAHGKNGYVKLRSYSVLPDRFTGLKKVYLDFWGDKKLFFIDDVKQVKSEVALKFKKFDTLRDVSVLIDREVYVDDKEKIKLPVNHFFIHDLIGSEVLVENESIGMINDVIEGKANDVLVVTNEDNEEKLVPLVLNFIEKFDADNKKLTLNISKNYLENDED